MMGSKKYGNLGLVVLPSSFAAIGIGMYLFIRLVWQTIASGLFEYTKFSATETIPHLHLSLFYINTSAMLFLVWISALLILVLASTGSWIGTGSRRLPTGTPLFFFFYCFFVPTWLFAAVYRAAFKTGVSWR